MEIKDIEDLEIKSMFMCFREHPTDKNKYFLFGYIAGLLKAEHIRPSEAEEFDLLIKRLESFKEE